VGDRPACALALQFVAGAAGAVGASPFKIG
jgi:hypothetical protein